MLASMLTEGFAYHATESERFASELEAAVGEARETPGQLVRFVRMASTRPASTCATGSVPGG